MAKFIGRGLLEQYSREVILVEPVPVNLLDVLLGIPENYGSNLIVVRGSKKLNASDLVYNDEDIILFLAAMGG